MNIGVNLPGPFRASISSSGQTRVGMNVGPVSMSTGTNRRQRGYAVQVMGRLDVALQEIQAEGWKVTGSDGRVAFIAKGMKAARLEQVGPYVVATPATSRAMMLVMLIVGAAILAAFYLSYTN